MKILTTESKSIASLIIALDNGNTHINYKGSLLSIRVLVEAHSLKYGMSEHTIRACISVGWCVYWRDAYSEGLSTVFIGLTDLFESRYYSERYMDFQCDYFNYYIKLED